METAAYHYQKGIEYKIKSEWDKALTCFEKTIELDPDHADALNEIGVVYFAKNNLLVARKYFKKCLQKAPDHLFAHYNTGLTFHDESPETALKYYNKSLQIDPDYAFALHQRGKIFLGNSDYANAKKDFERCLEVNDKDKVAYSHLALCYEQENKDKALELYDKAIQIDPEYYHAIHQRGRFYYDKGEYGLARKDFERSVELRPEERVGYYNVGLTYEKEDPHKALEFYLQTIQKDPGYFLAHFRAGLMYENTGNEKKAQEHFDRFLEIHPTRETALLELGGHFETRDPNKSIQYNEKALEINPKLSGACLNLGYAWQNKKELNKAVEYFLQCLETDPDNTSAIYSLGLCYEKQDTLKALEYAKKCLETDPGYSAAFQLVTYLFLGLKDAQSMRGEWEDFLQKLDSSQSYLCLGNVCLYAIKDYDQSEFFFQKSLEKDPKEKNAIMGLAHSSFFRGSIHTTMEYMSRTFRLFPNDPYLHHDKAFFLYQKREYQKAFKKFEEAQIEYEKKLKEDKHFGLDAYNYLYIGNIYYEVLGDLEKARYNLEKAKELLPRAFDKNLQVFASLLRVYAEMDKLEINPEKTLFWERRQLLIEAEETFTFRLATESNLLFMAEIYYIEELYDKAKGMIQECLSISKLNPTTFDLYGQILIAQQEYSQAIQALKEARRLQPFNFPIVLNLGNAFLKNKNFDDAQEIFLGILEKDPNNVDANVGLAEIQLGRAINQESDELFELADRHLKKALDLGMSNKGSKKLDAFKSPEPKRKYKSIPLSELYYSRGFIKSKQFEADKIGLYKNYLNESQMYFKLSVEYNPSNLKAIDARNQVNHKLNSMLKTRTSRVLGGFLIGGMAFFVFILSQYFFYFPPAPKNQYGLDSKSYTFLQAILPETEERKLESLVGLKFDEKNQLIAAMQNLNGIALSESQLSMLQQMDMLAETGENGERILNSGYYSLITFGSIIFLVAGLYLPQILKLKVGVLEIEKSSLSSVEGISMLNIKK